MLWAALYFPHFSLDAALRHQPDSYHKQALALIHGPAQRRVLLDVNPVAQSLGLRAQQSLNTARALCAEFVAIPHQSERDLALQQLLLNWAYRYSSMVCADRIDVMVLELASSMALFGPWPQLEQRLRSELAELGVRAQIALAPTALAAIALARACDGLAILQAAHLVRALTTIALSHTPIDAAQCQALQAMGIDKLGQLFALDRASLARRFPQLLRYLDQLRGLSADPRDYFVPPQRFEAHLNFDFELYLNSALLFPLKRMVGDLSMFLRQRERGVLRFGIEFLHLQQSSTIEIGLLEAEYQQERLFELVRLKLDSLTLPAAVLGLRLYADALAPLHNASRDLFDDKNPAQSFDALRERLRARLGSEALYQLDLHADPRPEHSQLSVAKLAREPVALARKLRPHWLLARPIPLRDVAPQILLGPERIESGWWDGAEVQRDYYMVRTTHGQIAWVFRPAGSTDGFWMLHGWY